MHWALFYRSHNERKPTCFFLLSTAHKELLSLQSRRKPQEISAVTDEWQCAAGIQEWAGVPGMNPTAPCDQSKEINCCFQPGLLWHIWTQRELKWVCQFVFNVQVGRVLMHLCLSCLWVKQGSFVRLLRAGECSWKVPARASQPCLNSAGRMVNLLPLSKQSTLWMVIYLCISPPPILFTPCLCAWGFACLLCFPCHIVPIIR